MATVNNSFDRRSVLRGIGAGAVAGLAGCTGDNDDTPTDGGEGDSGTDSGGGDSGTDAGDTQGDATDVLYWQSFYGFDMAKPIEGWVKNHIQEETNIAIETPRFAYPDLRQKFLTSASSGQPDMIETLDLHLYDYIAAGHTEPITDEVKSWDHFDGYWDNMVQAQSHNGEIYAMPYTASAFGLLYRKDIIEDKYGFEPPKTAADMIEIGREITKNEDGMYGFNCVTEKQRARAVQEFLSILYKHGDGVGLYENTDNGISLAHDSDVFARIFRRYYYDVFAADEPAGNPDNRNGDPAANDSGFLTGKYAMIQLSPWIIDVASAINKSEEGIDTLANKTGVTYAPPVEDGEREVSFFETKPIVINKYSDNKDAALSSLKRMVDPEGLAKYASESGYCSFQPHDDVDPNLAPVSGWDTAQPDVDNGWHKFQDIINNGVPFDVINWGPVSQALYDHIHFVIYEEQTPEEAGQSFHDKLVDLESEVYIG